MTSPSPGVQELNAVYTNLQILQLAHSLLFRQFCPLQPLYLSQT